MTGAVLLAASWMRRALAALAASALALSAGAAGDDGDSAASKGSELEAPLEARLKAAVRTIPGTDTQYLIGGYLQLDGIATRKKQDGDEQGSFIVSTTPFGAPDDVRPGEPTASTHADAGRRRSAVARGDNR
jgi:hypothetical protein